MSPLPHLLRILAFGLLLAPLLAYAGLREGLVSAPNAAPQQELYQVPYNGRFTFTRIRYGSDGFGPGRGSPWGWSSAWNHDYPQADRNM